MIIVETPRLECLNKNNQRQFWQAFGCKKDGQCYYYTLSWKMLANGSSSAQTPSVPSKVTGKNIGRANETTDEEQTIFEVGVLERKKREEGYHEEGQESSVAFPLSMLAHTYFDTVDAKGKVKKGHRDKIVFPCYVQPKLDGFRCPSDGEIFWSRTAKEWPQECVTHLKWDTNAAKPDGEVMLPLDMDFDLLKTAMSKYVPGLTDKVGHHIYDLQPDGVNVHEDTTFEDRYNYLVRLFKSAELSGILPPNVYLVKAVLCPDRETLEEVLLPKALAFGYEGVMARNAAGLYVHKHRSYDLQKVKLFMEEEFQVIDCYDGRGSDEGALMYRCVTKDGVEFKARPKGRIPARQKLWKEWLAGTFNPVGQMLTVEFFQYTSKGAPRFPKGKTIRNYE